jgi:hypothetical protein
MTLPTAELERLLISMCRHEQAGEFAAEWGNATPSEVAPGRLEIAEPAGGAFAGLEVRPWDGGAIGGVTLTLSAPTSLEDLEAWAGGLRELPAMPDGPVVHEGEWPCPEGDLEAILLVEEPDEPGGPVTRLSFRRGR